MKRPQPIRIILPAVAAAASATMLLAVLVACRPYGLPPSGQAVTAEPEADGPRELVPETTAPDPTRTLPRPTATVPPAAPEPPGPTLMPERATATPAPTAYPLQSNLPLWWARGDALWRSDVYGLEVEQLTSDTFLGWNRGLGPLLRLWLAPDGRWIAHAPAAGGLRLVDVELRQEVAIPVRGVWDLAWSPDGRFMAYAPTAPTVDCAICLYYVVDGERVALVERSPGPGTGVYSLSWSPDGSRLAFSCCFVANEPYDGLRTGEIQVVTPATGARESVGRTMLGIAGGPDRICWTETGEVTTEPAPEHSCPPHPIDMFEAVSSQNKLAAWEGVGTGGGWENTRLSVTDLATGEALWERLLPPVPLRLAWSPDGRYLFLDDDALDSPIRRIAADNSSSEEIIDGGYLLGIVTQWQAPDPSRGNLP